MKHTISITVLLVAIFLVAQIVGLFVVSEYINIGESNKQGKTVINRDVYENSIGGAPPEIKNQSISWVIIIMMVLVGTGLVLLIVKFRQFGAWKVWFFIAIMMCIANAIIPFLSRFGVKGSVTIPLLGETAIVKMVAIGIAATLAFLKLFQKNIIIHNVTEILIYGGLVAFLMPLINLVSAVFLLIAISIYDMYAVWRSKHMISMANFQTEAKMFAGLMLHYKKKSDDVPEEDKTSKVIKANIETDSSKKVKSHIISKSKKAKSSELKEDNKNDVNNESKTESIITDKNKEDDGMSTAILGGGDIAFPLIFASAVMGYFGNFFSGIIIVIFATIALSGLFAISKQGKFYPAMPFISVGCFIGLGVVYIADKLAIFI